MTKEKRLELIKSIGQKYLSDKPSDFDVDIFEDNAYAPELKHLTEDEAMELGQRPR